MNIPQSVKNLLLTLAIGTCIFLLIDGRKTDRKPLSSSEGDAEKQLTDAKMVFQAYRKALVAGETPSRLEELNRITEKNMDCGYLKNRVPVNTR